MASPGPGKTEPAGSNTTDAANESFLQRTISKLKLKRSAAKSSSPAARGTPAKETKVEAPETPKMTATTAEASVGGGVTQARATLASLLAANKSFADDVELRDEPHPAAPLELRKDLTANGQKPVATVIACADSRVPPELLFRGTVGTLFVLRTAGNVTDDEAVLASVEFAVAVLKTPLVLVMGHEHCGAVKASLTYKTDASYGPSLPANLGKHVGKMAACLPDVSTLEGMDDEGKTKTCVEAHTRAAAAALPVASAVVSGAVEAGDVLVVPAVYDIESGLVRVLE
jgi:carbonic anhydrase